MDNEAINSAVRVLLIVMGAIGLIGATIRYIRLEIFAYKNSRSPVETCRALAYSKDPTVGFLPQGRASSDVHYITFHTDGGDIVTLYMGPRDYYAIEEGARGKLTWQGARFWSFEPQ